MIKIQSGSYRKPTETCYRYMSTGHAGKEACATLTGIEAAVACHLLRLREDKVLGQFVKVRASIAPGSVLIDTDVDDLAWLETAHGVKAAYRILEEAPGLITANLKREVEFSPAGSHEDVVVWRASADTFYIPFKPMVLSE